MKFSNASVMINELKRARSFAQIFVVVCSVFTSPSATMEPCRASSTPRTGSPACTAALSGPRSCSCPHDRQSAVKRPCDQHLGIRIDAVAVSGTHHHVPLSGSFYCAD
jgi:hypothetical protein